MTHNVVFVQLSYATYGIEARNGIVVDAPPIARWMVGKPSNDVAAWITRKGGSFRIIGHYDNGTYVSHLPKEE